MIEQTLKLAAAMGLVALLTFVAIQNHWIDLGGLDLRGGLSQSRETQTAQSAIPFARTGASAPRSAARWGVVELSPDRNAQYQTDIEINGARIHALVDTGASHVVLTAEDARAANIDPPPSDYVVTAQTANGVATLAPTRLRELRVGDISESNVEALVARPGLSGMSLLGMSFLKKLSSYQVGDGHFVMKQ